MDQQNHKNVHQSSPILPKYNCKNVFPNDRVLEETHFIESPIDWDKNNPINISMKKSLRFSEFQTQNYSNQKKPGGDIKNQWAPKNGEGCDDSRCPEMQAGWKNIFDIFFHLMDHLKIILTIGFALEVGDHKAPKKDCVWCHMI